VHLRDGSFGGLDLKIACKQSQAGLLVKQYFLTQESEFADRAGTSAGACRECQENTPANDMS